MSSNISILPSGVDFAYKPDDSKSQNNPTVQLEIDGRALPVGLYLSTHVKTGSTENYRQNSKDLFRARIRGINPDKPTIITIKVEQAPMQINKKAVLVTLVVVGVLSSMVSRYFLS